MRAEYQKNSITLIGGISMGTGVMIGAGIFALTGQIVSDISACETDLAA